jgi:hypothetical protein
MNPKKKSRRYRASVSIQALDLAISRFIHSLADNLCCLAGSGPGLRNRFLGSLKVDKFGLWNSKYTGAIKTRPEKQVDLDIL